MAETIEQEQHITAQVILFSLLGFEGKIANVYKP